MDRSDEKRDKHDVEETANRDAGEILGLGGSPVPKAPGDPSTSHDPASVAQRRERMREEDTTGVSNEDPDRQRSGATGIDMGSGGQGTHVSGK